MKGDSIVIEKNHRKAARQIVDHIINEVNSVSRRYIITVAGESGSGKTETGIAIQNEFEARKIKAMLFGQDDYFVLPPQSNDAKRREDPEWLGPHIEVKLDVLEENLIQALKGENILSKPLIDYTKNTISEEKAQLTDVKVLIVEGTYTSLLRNVDKRIFINRNFEETLAHRRKRKRGSEANDPFIENILTVEHKIIAGHKNLADILITNEYDVIFQQRF